MGGILIYGVRNNGYPKGVDIKNKTEDQIVQKFEQKVSSVIYPNPIHIQKKLIKIDDDKWLFIVKIREGHRKLYSCRINNRWTFYRRVEKSAKNMDRDDIKYGFNEQTNIKNEINKFVEISCDLDEIKESQNKVCVIAFPYDFRSRIEEKVIYTDRSMWKEIQNKVSDQNYKIKLKSDYFDLKFYECEFYELNNGEEDFYPLYLRYHFNGIIEIWNLPRKLNEA